MTIDLREKGHHGVRVVAHVRPGDLFRLQLQRSCPIPAQLRIGTSGQEAGQLARPLRRGALAEIQVYLPELQGVSIRERNRESAGRTRGLPMVIGDSGPRQRLASGSLALAVPATNWHNKKGAPQTQRCPSSLATRPQRR